jgi:Flp pilus assembly pilin Flp
MQNLISYLRDQQGVETLEWILIGGLITGVGIVLYTIVGAITGAMP